MRVRGKGLGAARRLRSGGFHVVVDGARAAINAASWFGWCHGCGRGRWQSLGGHGACGEAVSVALEDLLPLELVRILRPSCLCCAIIKSTLLGINRQVLEEVFRQVGVGARCRNGSPASIWLRTRLSAVHESVSLRQMSICRYVGLLRRCAVRRNKEAERGMAWRGAARRCEDDGRFWLLEDE